MWYGRIWYRHNYKRESHIWKLIPSGPNQNKVMLTLLSKFLIRQDNGTKPCYKIFIPFPVRKSKLKEIKYITLPELFNVPILPILPSLEERLALFFSHREVLIIRHNSPAHQGIVLNYGLPVSIQLTVCL